MVRIAADSLWLFCLLLHGSTWQCQSASSSPVWSLPPCSLFNGYYPLCLITLAVSFTTHNIGLNTFLLCGPWSIGSVDWWGLLSPKTQAVWLKQQKHNCSQSWRLQFKVSAKLDSFGDFHLDLEMAAFCCVFASLHFECICVLVSS